MLVADILRAKGAVALMVQPTETIAILATRLRDERVGVMLVSEDNNALIGIISERDVAYGVATHGKNVLNLLVSDLMTANVVTCNPQQTIACISKTMTEKRIRHLPVVDNGRLVGIVSIGDVLKHRINEIELEKDVLRDIAIVSR